VSLRWPFLVGQVAILAVALVLLWCFLSLAGSVLSLFTESPRIDILENSAFGMFCSRDIRRAVQVRHGDFTTLNNRWGSSNSATVHERLEEDPSEWYLYHTLYREARADWPELPAEHIATHLQARPDLKVGDFGCGECLLKKALSQHEVIGLDHVAVDDSVIACDMAHAPLEDESLGAAVFSLSLMGRNWVGYLAEAHRVLKPFGLLFVAELAKRWEEGRLEQAVKGHVFNLMFSYQCDNFRYLGAVKGVV
jgi:hypothetical protein